MGTNAQIFYPSNDAADQTVSGQVQTRALNTGVPTVTSTTTVTWTTTTIVEKTVIPQTASAANGNTSQNSGWLVDKVGADGFDSTAAAFRTIAAGTWAFSVAVTLNTPALLDTHAATLRAYVYRVSNTGARTLLFSAASANFTATGTVTWNSAAQPAYVFTADETIMVGFTATSASTTALVLGANTNTVLTWQYGANTRVTLPAPGLRTQFNRSVADSAPVATDTITRIATFPRAIPDSPAVVDAVTRRFTGSRSLADSAPVADAVTRIASFPRALADSAPTTDVLTRQFTANRALADSAPVTDTLARVFTGNRSLADSAPVNDAITRTVIYSRNVVDALAEGGGAVNIYRPIFVFDD